MFNKKTVQALKLGSYFTFPYIRNMLKEQLFTASGSQFQELLKVALQVIGSFEKLPQGHTRVWPQTAVKGLLGAKRACHAREALIPRVALLIPAQRPFQPT